MPMNTPRPFRIKSPADLLALVPCVLGFHPEESIVLVVTAGEAGQLHARLDLPRDDEEVSEVVQTLLMAVSRAEALQVALVAYGADDGRVSDVVDLLVLELDVLGVDVLLAIRAEDERWYSLDCDEHCCPPEGEA
jgi:hypothetical protein